MDDEAVRKEILSRFPEGTIAEVRLFRHSDWPRLEPGEVAVELVLRGPEEYNADPDQAPKDVAQRVVNAFGRAHDAVLQQLLKDLPGLVGRPAIAGEQHQSMGVKYGRGNLWLSKITTKDDPRKEDDRLRQEILKRFPDDALMEVRIEHHEDRPNFIEPGELNITLVPRGPEEFNADPGKAPEAAAREVVYRFQDAHDAAIQQVRKDLPDLVAPERVRLLAVRYGRGNVGFGVGEPPPVERGLTPVMTRLNPDDLVTLDTLIAAGVAPSRAEAVRWCLARIRERPAYARIQERVREIERLKAEF